MGEFAANEYRYKNNAISLLNYHFILIPKRRKKVLVEAVAERLQEIICEVCNENRW
jgi:putative transposase